jgi:hypothetical protein
MITLQLHLRPITAAYDSTRQFALLLLPIVCRAYLQPLTDSVHCPLRANKTGAAAASTTAVATDVVLPSCSVYRARQM